MSKVTVVGCGLMGSALVNAYMNAGHSVTIIDLNEKAAAPFVERGANYSASLNDGMDNDFIFMIMPNHKIAKSIVESVDKDKWVGRKLINATTSSPKEVLDMQACILELGGEYLDAVIECYPPEIGTSAGYIVYAGDKQVFDFAGEALKALGRAEFLGDNVISTPLTDLTVGIHYGLYTMLLEGAAVCIRYNYPITEYLSKVDITLPLMLDAAKREVAASLTDYNGEFEDSKEANIKIELGGMRAGKKVCEEVDVEPVFSSYIVDVLQSMVDAGYEKKSMAAIVKKLLKE